MVKHIRKHCKEQTISVLLFISLAGDEKPNSVIYHMTPEDWDLVNWTPNTLLELYKWYNQHPLTRGIEYLGLSVKDIMALYDQGDLDLFHFDIIEHNGI